MNCVPILLDNMFISILRTLYSAGDEQFFVGDGGTRDGVVEQAAARSLATSNVHPQRLALSIQSGFEHPEIQKN